MTNITSINSKTLNLALCENKHSIPQVIDGVVFKRKLHPEEINNPKKLECLATYGLWDAAYAYFKKGISGYLRVWDSDDNSTGDILEFCPGLNLNLYVTGLTVALVAILNICHEANISVTLWYYDKNTNSYFNQKVL